MEAVIRSLYGNRNLDMWGQSHVSVRCQRCPRPLHLGSIHPIIGSAISRCSLHNPYFKRVLQTDSSPSSLFSSSSFPYIFFFSPSHHLSYHRSTKSLIPSLSSNSYTLNLNPIPAVLRDYCSPPNFVYRVHLVASAVSRHRGMFLSVQQRRLSLLRP